MRIALYHNLPQGGALRFVRETTRRSAASHEIDVYRIVDPSAPGHPQDGLAAWVRAVHSVPYRWPADFLPKRLAPLRSRLELVALWTAEAEVAARIDAGNYDLCVVHPCRLTQSPSLLRRLRTPTLYYAHEPRRRSFERVLRQIVYGSAPRRWQRGALYAEDAVLGWADRRAVAGATALACNSLFTAEALYWAYGRDSALVLAGIDRDVFRPNAAARDNYVLSVGALDPMKGHAEIVEALGSLAVRDRPSLKIVYERVVPGYDALLKDTAYRKGVGIELYSGVSDARLAELYSAALAAVCAARLEPFGVTPLESLNCGTPVVAINEGGFRETISDGHNGILVPPTIEGLARGIADVVSGKLGADDRQRLRASVSPLHVEQGCR